MKGRTVKQYIINNPKEIHETPTEYFRRLEEQNDNGWTFSSFKAKYYKVYNNGLQISKIVKRPDGKQTEVYHRKTDEVKTKGLKVKGVTTNPYGGQWIKYSNDDGISEEDIDKVLKRVLAKHPVKELIIEKPKVLQKAALHVVLTDDHVGMETNEGGEALMPYSYKEKDYRRAIKNVFRSINKEVAQYGAFEEIVINNLGDLEDGWDGKTTRGGHDLPQRLSNDEVLDLVLDTRLELIEKLIKIKAGKKIVLRVVTNSNHSASFAMIVAKMLKRISDLMFGGIVEVDILKRFIEHRVYGDHCFLLTHGKDKKELRGGMPLHLTDKVVNYIVSYLDYYGLRDYKHVHLWKGDLHRLGVSSCKSFDYTSFRSVCPPSNWILTNFGDMSYAGYSIIIVPKFNGDLMETHVKLDYKKVAK